MPACLAFDRHALLLYVTIHQLFSIWFIPFHRAPARLTTVLQLTTDPSFPQSQEQHALKPPQYTSARKKYYIQSQNDLYQTSEFVKFVLPWAGMWLVMLGQFFATFLCVVGTTLGWPLTWLEENVAGGNRERGVEGRGWSGVMQ